MIDPTDFELSDGVASEAAQNQFMRARAAALDDGLFQLKGGDAVAAAPDAERRLSDLRDTLLDQAATPSQRALLAPDLDSHMDAARNDIARHVARETAAWDRDVRAKRVDLLQGRAWRDYDEPDRIALYAEAAASAGDPTEVARSSVWRSGIEGALSNGAHKAALDLIDHARQHLSPADAEMLAPQMVLAAQLLTGRNYVASLLPESMPATSAETDEAYRQALRANKEAWVDDPEQLATNKHLLDVRFGARQRDLHQAKADRDRDVENWLALTDATGGPQTERPPPALWLSLNPDERQKVDAQLAENAQEGPPATGGQPFVIDIEASRRILQQMQVDQGLPIGAEGSGGQGAVVNTEPAPDSPEYQQADAEARRIQQEEEQGQDQGQGNELDPEPAPAPELEPELPPNIRSSGKRFMDGFTDNAERTWEGVKAVGDAAVEGAKQTAADLWNKPVETVAAATARINPAMIVATQGTRIARAFAADPKGAVERGLRRAADTGSAIWHGIADPYEDAYRKGGLAQAAGYGTFDVARLALEAALTKGTVSAAAAGKTLAGLSTIASARRRGKQVSNKIPTIGGYLPVNWEWAGMKHPSGVWFTEQGFPDFSPHAKKTLMIKNLTTDRKRNYRLCNTLAGLPGMPKGYTWHHVEDGKTMQLIPTWLHKLVNHTGGIAVLKNGGFD